MSRSNNSRKGSNPSYRSVRLETGKRGFEAANTPGAKRFVKRVEHRANRRYGKHLANEGIAESYMEAFLAMQEEKKLQEELDYWSSIDSKSDDIDVFDNFDTFPSECGNPFCDYYDDGFDMHPFELEY